MATISFYLDTRASGNKPAPLKLRIAKNGETALLNTGVYLRSSQWDAKRLRVKNRPDSPLLNDEISRILSKSEATIISAEYGKGGKALSAAALRNLVTIPKEEEPEEGTFIKKFLSFADSPSHKEGTRRVYRQTLSRIRAYDPNADALTFEDIDKAWLNGFDAFMRQTAPSRNARNIHFRNIRSVFNDAIDDELTAAYPFRKFKIKAEPTRKRSLSVYQLRELFSAPVEPHAEKYRDAFKLMFLLCGINVVDLCYLKTLRNGRIEYSRAKTGRLYSIKVEPEALELINKYRGTGQLLDIMDRYTDHNDYGRRLNRALKHIGKVTEGKRGKKTYEPLFPELTTYWARHTWATIAASLDIPKETIAAALGHGGNTVTDIYIDFDQRKIDKANRKVIDWVLYGIGGPED